MAGDITYQLLSENKRQRISIEGQIIVVSELKKRISQELGHKEELCIYTSDHQREYQDNEKIPVHSIVLVERKQNSMNTNFTNSKYLKCDKCQGQNPTKTQCCSKKICKTCKDESKRNGKCIFCGITQQQADKQMQQKNEQLRKIKENLNLPSDKEYQSLLENARFFFIRSCNQENITFALQQSIWATTQKNERALFDAFRKAKNVILIFGVNKTNYFQGVARMQQQILDKNSYKTPWKNTEAIKLGEDFLIRWLRVEDLPHQNCSDLKNALCNNEQLISKPKDCQEIDADNGKKLCMRFSLNTDEVGYLGSGGQSTQLNDWSQGQMIGKVGLNNSQFGNTNQFNNYMNNQSQPNQQMHQVQIQNMPQNFQQPSPQLGIPSQNNLNITNPQQLIPKFNTTNQLEDTQLTSAANLPSSYDINYQNQNQAALGKSSSNSDTDTTILLSESIRQYNQSIEISEEEFFNIFEELQPYKKQNNASSHIQSSASQDGQSLRGNSEGNLDKIKSQMELEVEQEQNNMQVENQENNQNNEVNSQPQSDNENDSINGSKEQDNQSKSQLDQIDQYSNNNDQQTRESQSRYERRKEDDLSDDDNENNQYQNEEESSNQNNNSNYDQRESQLNSNHSSDQNIQNNNNNQSDKNNFKEDKQPSSEDLKKRVLPNSSTPLTVPKIPRPGEKVIPNSMMYMNPMMMRPQMMGMGFMGYPGFNPMAGLPMLNPNFTKPNKFMGMIPDGKINLLNPNPMMPNFNQMNKGLNNKINNINDNGFMNMNQENNDMDQQNQYDDNQGNYDNNDDQQQQNDQDMASQNNSNYDEQDNYDQDSQNNEDDYRNEESSNNRYKNKYNNNSQSSKNKNYQNNNNSYNNSNSNINNYNNRNNQNGSNSNRSNNNMNYNNNRKRNINSDNNYDQNSGQIQSSNVNRINNKNPNNYKNTSSSSGNNGNRSNYNKSNNNQNNRYNNNYQDSDYSDNQQQNNNDRNNYNDYDNASRRDKNSERSRNRSKDEKRTRDLNNNQNNKRDRERDRSHSSNSQVRSKKRISQSPSKKKDRK